MKKFYRSTCKHCGRNFETEKLLQMEIKSTPEIGLTMEIDLANVIQNNYHYEKELPNDKGKVTINLSDLALDMTCPFCKKSDIYSLRQLVLTDRLD